MEREELEVEQEEVEVGVEEVEVEVEGQEVGRKVEVIASRRPPVRSTSPGVQKTLTRAAAVSPKRSRSLGKLPMLIMLHQVKHYAQYSDTSRYIGGTVLIYLWGSVSTG